MGGSTEAAGAFGRRDVWTDLPAGLPESVLAGDGLEFCDAAEQLAPFLQKDPKPDH
jgi:hypothetical protein